MKKFLAVLMALIMVLSCSAAFAENEQLKGSFHLSFTVAEESMMKLIEMTGTKPNDNTKQVFGSILDTINGLSVQAVLDGEKAQMSLLLNEKNLASTTLAADEEKLVLVSDLIPNYAITLDSATVLQAMEKLQEFFGGEWLASLEPLMEEIGKEAAAAAEGLIEKLESGMNMEIGGFVQEGAAFNAKISWNLTLGELAAVGVDFIDRIQKNEVIKACLDKAAENLPQLIEKLQEKGIQVNVSLQMPDPADLEKLNQVPLHINVYTLIDEQGAASENFYVVVDSESALATWRFSMGAVDEIMYIHMVGGEGAFENEEAVRAAAKVNGKKAMAVDAVCGLLNECEFVLGEECWQDGFFFGIAQDQRIQDNKISEDTEYYFLTNTTPALTIHEELILGEGEITENVTTENKTVLRVEDAMKAEGQKIGELLQKDFNAYGVNAILTNFAAAAPAEVSMMLGMLLPTSAVK